MDEAAREKAKAYRRSNTLRLNRPQVDTTLESSLNGRRRCKGSVALISQANGQRCFITLGAYYP